VSSKGKLSAHLGKGYTESEIVGRIASILYSSAEADGEELRGAMLETDRSGSVEWEGWHQVGNEWSATRTKLRSISPPRWLRNWSDTAVEGIEPERRKPPPAASPTRFGMRFEGEFTQERPSLGQVTFLSGRRSAWSRRYTPRRQDLTA